MQSCRGRGGKLQRESFASAGSLPKHGCNGLNRASLKPGTASRTPVWVTYIWIPSAASQAMQFGSWIGNGASGTGVSV